MFKINFKKILPGFILVFVIFLIDRIAKNYILKVAEIDSAVDIFINEYLNIYLIWNKGIAFGLFSFEAQFLYNSISFVIGFISIIIMIWAIKSNGFKKYSLLAVLAGAISNLYDRIYYSAVPDFIDLHIGTIHWFIFNPADIFISFGVVCLIFNEIYNNNNKNENI
jgi:signal peptidase II